MAVLGRGRRGKPKRRWFDVGREDIVKVGALEGDGDWAKWRRMTRCGDPE